MRCRLTCGYYCYASMNGEGLRVCWPQMDNVWVSEEHLLSLIDSSLEDCEMLSFTGGQRFRWADQPNRCGGLS